MLQSRINRFVERMPMGRIKFMGYVWPAELIQPKYDFNKIKYPTLMQCLECIIGVDLSFYDGPPKMKIDSWSLFCYQSRIYYAMINIGSLLAPLSYDVKRVNGYTSDDFSRELVEFNDLAYQIYTSKNLGMKAVQKLS